jgi:hypothetical protein
MRFDEIDRKWKEEEEEGKWIRGLCGGESLMLDDSYYAHSHGKSLSFLLLRICLKENHYTALILVVIVHLFQFSLTANVKSSLKQLKKSQQDSLIFFSALGTNFWPSYGPAKNVPLQKKCMGKPPAF